MKLDDVFGIHEQALKLRARRGEVLAANLANADTPGFKARDIDFRKVLDQQLAPPPVRLAATRASHIQGHRADLAPSQLQYRVPQQVSLDGNSVEIEAEQARFGANALQYQASLGFIDGTIKRLMTAITGN
jgi:flagellar basal-body rod protein FlgB